MGNTNVVLQTGYERLEADYDELQIVQDENLMCQLHNQMEEVTHLRYEIRCLFFGRNDSRPLCHVTWPNVS